MTLTTSSHMQVFGDVFDWFIWPCVIIWSLDRFLRLARIAYCSVLPRLLNGFKAVMTYDARSEMIRVDVTNVIRDDKIRPGVFYYLYAPAAVRGYESHPFTLCSWKQTVIASHEVSAAPSLADGKPKFKGENTVQSISADDEPESIRHSFLIRPYHGFTGRLRERVSSSLEERSSCQLTVLLEGPYGSTLDPSSYSDVLVIAGGSGITAAISPTHMLLGLNSIAVQIV